MKNDNKKLKFKCTVLCTFNLLPLRKGFNELSEVNSGAGSSFWPLKHFDFFCKCFERITIVINRSPLMIFWSVVFWKATDYCFLVTLSQARTSIYMTSRILNDGNSLLFSRAVTMRLTDKTLYLNFSDQISPWSIDCAWASCIWW